MSSSLGTVSRSQPFLATCTLTLTLTGASWRYLGLSVGLKTARTGLRGGSLRRYAEALQIAECQCTKGESNCSQLRLLKKQGAAGSSAASRKQARSTPQGLGVVADATLDRKVDTPEVAALAGSKRLRDDVEVPAPALPSVGSSATPPSKGEIRLVSGLNGKRSATSARLLPTVRRSQRGAS